MRDARFVLGTDGPEYFTKCCDRVVAAKSREDTSLGLLDLLRHRDGDVTGCGVITVSHANAGESKPRERQKLEAWIGHSDARDCRIRIKGTAGRVISTVERREAVVILGRRRLSSGIRIAARGWAACCQIYFHGQQLLGCEGELVPYG